MSLNIIRVMAKVRSKFETIERVRKEIEEKALLEMANKQRELNEALSERARQIAAVASGVSEREGAPAIGVNAPVLEYINQFIIGSKQRIARANHRIQVCSRNLDKARAFYHLKNRERKVITRLIEIEAEERKSRERKIEEKRLQDSYIKLEYQKKRNAG